MFYSDSNKSAVTEEQEKEDENELVVQRIANRRVVKSRRKYLILKLFTILPAITILWSATGTNSLSCYCNLCNTDTCETAPNNESYCYKSVERYLIKENGTYITEASYGCLSGGDGLLAPLQCHANSLKHTEPRFISCCKDKNYCNEYLPDPTEEDDPRWSANEPPEREEPYFKVYKWQLILLIGVVVLSIACILLKLMIMKRARSKSSNASQASSYFLEADLEKFTHQHVTSSSISTHSYSISDDLCLKPEPSNAADDSFIPTDLTSGVGERMLNQRTMARAVGSGKTDHVGSGRFGRVFRGEWHGEDVAVKAFRTIDQESWMREDTIFRNLNHENIVRFITSQVYPVDDTTTEIWMFLEYCPFGSLCDYLDHNEILGSQQAVKILYSIINGLNYLHEDYAQASRLYKPSIAHRDIKSKNILMKSPDTCCIADFGHALIKLDEDTLDYGKYHQHLQVGTIRYMAPEILKKNDSLNYRHFTTFAQADLYQYGLILWEVCHRTALDILHPAGNHKLPYDGVVPQNPDIQDMVKIVCEDQYRPPRYDKWDKYPMMKRLAELMVECWRPNPKARMETLGVKKKLRELYDQVVIPSHSQQYQLNLFNNFSLSPNCRNDSNKTRSSDVTL